MKDLTEPSYKKEEPPRSFQLAKKKKSTPTTRKMDVPPETEATDIERKENAPAAAENKRKFTVEEGEEKPKPAMSKRYP